MTRLTRRQLLQQAGGGTLAAASIARGVSPVPLDAAAAQDSGAAPPGPSSDVTARIQEMHITLGQMLCGALERALGLAGPAR